MLLTVQDVRKYKALTTSAVYGDGPACENPIDCQGANKLVLLMVIKRVGAVADMRVGIEWASGLDSQYSDGAVSVSGGTGTVRRVEYKVDTNAFVNGEIRNYALSVDVENRWARVWAKSTLSADPELGIIAETGFK